MNVNGYDIVSEVIKSTGQLIKRASKEAIKRYKSISKDYEEPAKHLIGTGVHHKKDEKKHKKLSGISTKKLLNLRHKKD